MRGTAQYRGQRVEGLRESLNGAARWIRTSTDRLLRPMPLPIGLLRQSTLELLAVSRSRSAT